MKRKTMVIKAAFITMSLAITSCDLLPTMTPSARKRSSKEENDTSIVDNSSSRSPVSNPFIQNSESYNPFYPTSEYKDQSTNYNDTTNSSDPIHVHTFEESWTSNATKHWHRATCGHNIKSDEAAHTWTDYNVIATATCTENGAQEKFCTVCGYRVTQEIKALGHEFDENNINWIQEPTCTEQGIAYLECIHCHETLQYTVPAFGHDFDDNINWIQEPTCTEYGYGERVCNRCGMREEASVQPLGHDYVMVDNQGEPEEDKAKVCLYQCTRCNDALLGFKANDVTAESKSRLVFDKDGGARFWGRPIGNAMALDQYGTSVNQENNECVYCSTETGDFFEYVFDLTEQQAAMLSTCRLYCDAQPADYLNGNDFWAYGRSNDEWTPGYYIDDDDSRFETDENGDFVMVNDHARAGSDSQPGAELETLVRKGKRIEDYRYVLYVDDQVVDFDSTITNPTHGSGTNMVREEFVVPYTFHLHPGTNKISLRMAGGYRSTFYNFIFRPAEQHVHNWTNEQYVPAEGEDYVGYTKSTCSEDSATQLSIDTIDGTFLDGASNKSGIAYGYVKLNANGNSISYTFNYSGPAATAKLYQVGYMDGWQSNKNKGYTSTTTTSTSLGPTGCNFGVKFNGVEVDIDEGAKAATFEELLAGASIVVDESANYSNAGPCLIGEIALVVGENQLQYTRYASYNLNISQFLIVIE